MDRAANGDVNLFSPEFRQDRTGFMTEMLRTCPVSHSSVGDYFMVTRYADITQCCRDPELWSSARGAGLKHEPADAPGVLVNADPPEHGAQVRLVQSIFTAAYVRSMEGEIRDYAAGLVQGLAASGRADLHQAFASRIPLFVISGMLGIPFEQNVERYRRWALDAAGGVLCDPADTGKLARAALARDEMFAFFEPLVEAWREKVESGEVPGDTNLITRLASAESDGYRLPASKILSFCNFLLVAGSATTATLISNLIHRLLVEPEQFARLKADMSLLPSAIEESLRLDGPLNGLFRTNNQAADLHGVHIPKDSKVMMMWAAGNLDPEYVDNPTVFDITRDPKLLRRQLSFGHGIHVCLGAALARLEARVAIEELLRIIPEPRLAAAPVRDCVDILNTPEALWVEWDPDSRSATA